MQYVLRPTDDDILHYKKGSESKTHKYISRVLKNGKWVYIYTKNRLRGNKVTNKNGIQQYSPNIKTGGKEGSHIYVEHDPSNLARTVSRDRNVLNESLNPDLAAVGMYKFSHALNSHRSNPMVTNRTPYPYDDNGNWVDRQYSPSNQAINTRTRGTAYEPSQSSKAASSRHYTPNEKQFGNYKPLSGSSLSEGVDYDKLEREINGNLDRQDRNSYKTKTVTKKKKR